MRTQIERGKGGVSDHPSLLIGIILLDREGSKMFTKLFLVVLTLLNIARATPVPGRACPNCDLDNVAAYTVRLWFVDAREIDG